MYKNIVLGLILTIGSGAWSSTTYGQMLSNQGALVSVNGGFMSVHGDVVNDNNGTFHNTDTIYAFNDWENYANNEAFTSLNEGIVRMVGDSQTIGGTNPTRFYDLRLENTGIKFAEVDVYVNGFLRLNDREMRADTHTVHVFNTDINAVETGLNTVWGFVSNEGDGGLLRHTNQQQPYFYPVGSAQIPPRFRPVELTPEDANTASFKVRFANVDPTNEGYDKDATAFEVCEVNPFFYHRIGRSSGTTNATLAFFYDAASEGDYNAVANWTVNNLWLDVSETTLSSNATYNLDVVTTDNTINSFLPKPFALANIAPPMDVTLSQNPICADEELTITANGDFPEFDFYVDTFLLQSGNADTYTTLLDEGFHTVWAVGNLPTCGRASDTVTVEVYPSVTAQASNDTIIVEGSIANLSATGGDFYEWTPADSVTCSICDATEAFPEQPTTFVVRVENIDGCWDTDTVFVDVRTGAGEVVFIPNALTPNGDGKNDTWFIQNIELFPTNTVHIVNRWGDIVYKSENYQNDWEGNYAAGLLPAGTYYYVLDLGEGWGIFKGPVTIIRE